MIFFDHNCQTFCDLLLRDSFENQISAFAFYSSKVGLNRPAYEICIFHLLLHWFSHFHFACVFCVCVFVSITVQTFYPRFSYKREYRF